jgi:AraC-like DNA-binding protein
MKQLPIYSIPSLTKKERDEFLISRFAPYLHQHHQLKIPHRHSFYHLVVFTEGSGSQMIDFREFPVKPWQAYFMIPGQVHHWNFTGPADGYVINFSASFFQSFLLQPDYLDTFSFFRGIPAESVLDVPGPLRETIHTAFEELLSLQPEGGLHSADPVRALLLRLFFLFGQITEHRIPQGVSPYAYTQLQQFRKLINLHYATLRLSKEYAGLLFITPNHLNAISRHYLGRPAGQVIRERVLLEAKRMLVNPANTVASVAEQLNFKDASYFSRFFKKLEGSAPETFRKHIFKQHDYE